MLEQGRLGRGLKVNRVQDPGQAEDPVPGQTELTRDFDRPLQFWIAMEGTVGTKTSPGTAPCGPSHSSVGGMACRRP